MARTWIRVVVLLCFAVATMAVSVTRASDPPFDLPMTGEPGPSTWYVSQWYGNTVWAYHNWPDLYDAGQGLHFGIDFAAPCGTPIVAIGDGQVFAVDGPYGSDPHNAVIDHGNGYHSLYGHLLERSGLREGDPVARGDLVGYVGDPAGECDQAPHLHLEIRHSDMMTAVNPIPLFDADWRRLTAGAQTHGTRFAVDYRTPGWAQFNDDQPDTRFGGPVANDREVGWPPR